MLTLQALEQYLTDENACYELIRQDAPILSAQDGARHFDPQYAAPTLVVQTENGLMSVIFSAQRGRLDFDSLKIRAGLAKCRLADAKKAERATGYTVGSIPLVGLELPCMFDSRLLEFPFLYGGSGDPLCTLKITPEDVKRLNPIALCFD